MTTVTAVKELKQRWDDLLAARPNTRIRNAASELGVSEVELLVLNIGQGVTRLRPEFKELLAGTTQLGRVMALTRNDAVVHERKGIYLNPSLEGGHVGLFVGADIDLRIFWGAWSSAFAVEEPGKNGPRFSMQYFGKDGAALHKTYLTEESNVAAYHELVRTFRSDDQAASEDVGAPRPEAAEKSDDAIDVEGLRRDWTALKDTHDFHLLLRTYGVSRTQALRLAPVGFAVPVDGPVLRRTITEAAALQFPLMVFVGNAGMLQIHTGTVTNLVEIPEWFNVIDPDFNLHVREASIARSWIVRKPTIDGIVTALECYDPHGTQLVQLFGARKPGIPEKLEWTVLMERMEKELGHV